MVLQTHAAVPCAGTTLINCILVVGMGDKLDGSNGGEGESHCDVSVEDGAIVIGVDDGDSDVGEA